MRYLNDRWLRSSFALAAAGVAAKNLSLRPSETNDDDAADEKTRQVDAKVAAAQDVEPTTIVSGGDERKKRVDAAVRRFLVSRDRVDSPPHEARLQSVTGAPGVAIGISIDGRVAHERGYGLADVENGVRVTSATVMRIASVTKPITAAIVGQLVERRLLHWEDSVYVRAESSQRAV